MKYSTFTCLMLSLAIVFWLVLPPPKLNVAVSEFLCGIVFGVAVAFCGWVVPSGTLDSQEKLDED